MHAVDKTPSQDIAMSYVGAMAYVGGNMELRICQLAG